MTFRGLLLDRTEHGDVRATLSLLTDDQLPDGGVTIDVEYSSLNYKDGMALRGLGGLVRTYPHVPGIDLSGTVSASETDGFDVGDRVVLTGWGVGETRWGGFAQRARVDDEWPAKLPDHVSTRQAMAIGTAGFTAMQALIALEDHGLTPSTDHPLLVTGASGGVGSSALIWAAAAGHHSIASTGRRENEAYLRSLGAAEVIDRASIASAPSRPLLGQRWHGCIDAVGGDTLAHVLAETAYGRSVAAVGLAGGSTFEAALIPFLLRGVSLLGIDSVMASAQMRQRVNVRLAQALADTATAERLESITTVVRLGDVPSLASEILSGAVRGRVVVDCSNPTPSEGR